MRSPARQAKIDALLLQVRRGEVVIAALILTCITRGTYFDADEARQTHPRALELAHLYLGDD